MMRMGVTGSEVVGGEGDGGDLVVVGRWVVVVVEVEVVVGVVVVGTVGGGAVEVCL